MSIPSSPGNVLWSRIRLKRCSFRGTLPTDLLTRGCSSELLRGNAPRPQLVRHGLQFRHLWDPTFTTDYILRKAGQLLIFSIGCHVHYVESVCVCCIFQDFSVTCQPVWSWGNPPPHYPFISSPFTLSFSVFYFSLSYSLLLFSSFSIHSHCIRIVPLRFLAGCHRRRLNLALGFLVLCVFFS